MQIVNIYRYIRDDGGITHSITKPDDVEYTILYRLIADEDKELVNGDIHTECIDVDDIEKWLEIDASPIDDEIIG